MHRFKELAAARRRGSGDGARLGERRSASRRRPTLKPDERSPGRKGAARSRASPKEGPTRSSRSPTHSCGRLFRKIAAEQEAAAVTRWPRSPKKLPGSRRRRMRADDSIRVFELVLRGRGLGGDRVVGGRLSGGGLQRGRGLRKGTSPSSASATCAAIPSESSVELAERREVLERLEPEGLETETGWCVLAKRIGRPGSSFSRECGEGPVRAGASA